MPKTYYDQGDAIKGEKIIAKGRRFSDPKAIEFSSRHHGTQYTITRGGFCVIDRPVKSVRERKIKS